MDHKRIGIIGGVGPTATVLYYNQIIQYSTEQWKGTHLPEIFIHSMDYEEIKKIFLENDLESVTEKLVQSITCLEKSGCHCIVMACNGMHIVLDQVQQRVGLPVISIIDAVTDEIKKNKRSCVGLMGTTMVMQSQIYQKPLQKLGIQCVVPPDNEQEMIMDVILKELQLPSIPGKTVNRLVETVESLKNQGAQEIVFICTDLPVAVKPSMCSIPIMDSTAIHVKTVIDYLTGDQ